MFRMPMTLQATKSIRGQDTVVRCLVKAQDLAHWIAGLYVVLDGIVDGLTLVTADRAIAISITLDASVPKGERARMKWHDAKLSLQMTRVELEYWLAFLGRYYATGHAEVDHIDLDSRADMKSATTRITLLMAECAPAVSSNEARRRLGLS